MNVKEDLHNLKDDFVINVCVIVPWCFM